MDKSSFFLEQFIKKKLKEKLKLIFDTFFIHIK